MFYEKKLDNFVKYAAITPSKKTNVSACLHFIELVHSVNNQIRC